MGHAGYRLPGDSAQGRHGDSRACRHAKIARSSHSIAKESVGADGPKLPAHIVVKGKTPHGRVELGGIAGHAVHFRDKGWRTIQTEKLYMECMR